MPMSTAKIFLVFNIDVYSYNKDSVQICINVITLNLDHSKFGEDPITFSKVRAQKPSINQMTMQISIECRFLVFKFELSIVIVNTLNFERN